MYDFTQHHNPFNKLSPSYKGILIRRDKVVHDLSELIANLTFGH